MEEDEELKELIDEIYKEREYVSKHFKKGGIEMKYNWKKWLKCAGIRAIKTVAQTAASLITVGSLITEIDWLALVSVSLVAGVYSLLTSIAGLPEVDKEL